MSTANDLSHPTATASREEMMSALFANLVVQQTNMAFIFLGRAPHPDTGEVMQDLESAKFFIDQLEMIEAKTKGNLNPREDSLLKQSLTGLRMAFVEAMDGKDAAPPAAKPIEASADQPMKREHTSAPAAPAPETKSPAEDESRKKFSKKY